MATNEIKSFAGGAGATVLSQAEYELLTTIIANGFQHGLLPAAQLNKVLRQLSLVSSAVSQYIAETTGTDVLDNGDVGALRDLLTLAVSITAGPIGASTLKTLLAGTSTGQGADLVGATPGAAYAAGTVGAWINSLAVSVAAIAAGQSSGVVGYATKAAMNADLAHPAGTVAYVTNDATLSNNGTYLKSGASGAGAWTLAADRTTSLETRATDLETASPFVAGCRSEFRAVRRLTLLGADTTKFYSVSFFFRNDVGTRFNFTVTKSNDAVGTGAVDVASFTSSGVNYSGLVEFTLNALSGSGITGTLVVDFVTSPATWAMYRGSGGATFANTAIRNDAIATSAACAAYDLAATQAALAPVLALVPGKNLPFADELSNDFLRRFVKSIWVYGADTSHVYIIKQVELQLFRRTVLLHDLTTATDVAKWSITVSVTDYTTQPRYVQLVQGSLGTYTGVYALVEFDWTQAITGTNNYTTAVDSGVHPSRVRSDEMILDYIDRDVWHEVIPVGAGQTYTTLRAAVESLYDSVSVTTCARAGYDHQILLDLLDAGTYNATLLVIPQFVGVRGQGVDRTFIRKESDATDAMLEVHLETKFRDLTIVSDTGDGASWLGEYCLHSDDFNRLSKPTTPNRRLRQSFSRLKLRGGANQNAWLFGCGVSSGQHIRFTDVNASHDILTSSIAAFGFHNTGISVSARPGLVEMIGCKSSDAYGTGAAVLSLGGGNKCRLTLIGCDLGVVAQGVTGSIADKAADRYEWEIGGVYAGPIVQNDPGMVVLKTSPGATPSGTAAAIVFGAVDELGQGELCIEGGTSKSLGARLGDCTSVNKTLTISGQTWTANANYTAQSNATIIAAMNVSLTTSPVSEKNIQWQIYPDTGYTRRMLNSTGATISAGRFVKRTGVNTIALASGSDDVFGVVYRDILDGLGGSVITGRQIHRNYIDSTATDGQFGVTAGVLDFGASTKRGFIAGGIATLY